MREHRAKSGRLIYYATRDELEALAGYHPAAGGRQGRARCPIHAGDNPTALAINWETGWARCWRCGDAFAIRVADADAPRGNFPTDAPLAPRNGPSRDVLPPKAPEPMPAVPAASAAALEAAITAAAARLPDSPGAAYLAGRGIPLDVARQLRLGWGTSGKLAGRVVFPLTDPAGVPTSAIGRAITDTRRPKYDTLPAAKGYRKTLFNGGAVALARQAGAPLVLVEGPLDAAACVAGGVPFAAALCGTAYAHPEHFAGLATVILALDGDPAGQAGRQALWLALTGYGVAVLLLPAAALDGAKDLAAYWQRHGRLPALLTDPPRSPHAPADTPCTPAAPARTPGPPMRAENPHVSEVPPCQPAGVAGDDVVIDPGPYAALARRAMAFDLDLDALDPVLRAEAEALAAELAGDPAALDAFVADLQRAVAGLSAAEAAAAWYAVQLAVFTLDTAAAA